MLGPSKNKRARATAVEAERIAAQQPPRLRRLSNNAAGFNKLSKKQIAAILGFLDYKQIMISRRVSRKFCDAAKETIVPMYHGDDYRYSHQVNLFVNCVKTYNGMRAMTRAVPNLQYLTIGYLGYETENRHKYNDGEDPDEARAAQTSNYISHDIGIISNFRKLRILELGGGLNGKYPALFNFPLLQVLDIDTSRLKWDLDMLVGLPSLRELNCTWNDHVTGNIKSLIVLNRTLKAIKFHHCNNIEGKFTDLADFPRLESLQLKYCYNVTGDIRKLGSSDFPKLTKLELSKGVIGGDGYEFQRLSDAPSVLGAIYRLSRRDPSPFPDFNNYHLNRSWKLSMDSPDWYDAVGQQGIPSPPHTVHFVRVGTRLGWRWMSPSRYGRATNSCEIQWLDPEPGRDSSGYEDYIRELESIQDDIFCLEGYDQPPTAEEYNRLCEEYYGI
jgi:hypothetical protein